MSSSLVWQRRFDQADHEFRAILELAEAYDRAKIADEAAKTSGMKYPQAYPRLMDIADAAWEEVEDAYEHWVRIR